MLILRHLYARLPASMGRGSVSLFLMIASTPERFLPEYRQVVQLPIVNGAPRRRFLPRMEHLPNLGGGRGWHGAVRRKLPDAM
ncbi:hypothetical protein EEI76_15590 [Enterobacter cloacae]|nr:hypothetical protein EEI76_15590 [Enterobacter cloacae]